MSATDQSSAGDRERPPQVVGAQRVTLRPPTYRTRRLPYIAGVLAVLALVPMRYPGAYELSIANRTITYAIAALGFYLVFGMSGQFAFSHAAFFGLGAYGTAWASRGNGFWVGVIAAAVISAAVAAIFLLLVRRAGHFYFAIATLGLSEIGIVVFTEWESFTGSAGQVQVSAKASVLGFIADSQLRMFWFLAVALGLALLLTAWIERSPVRREAIAVRDHPEVAASFGAATLKVRLSMFVLGSAYAGVAGALFAHDQGYISPASFSVTLGINIFLMVILGGLGSMWGAVIGAVFVVLFPEWLREFAEYRELLFALLLIGTILVLPEGITGVRTVVDRIGRAHARGR